MISVEAISESELVAKSASGDREAFGCIVERYQSFVAALAYSATGSINQSEDICQEVFVAAWRNLGELRESSKLRPWLCGIARNQINNSFRKKSLQPVVASDSTTLLTQMDSAPSPHEQAVSREEEAILWRSIGEIPELYREPLVLFYREQQSIEGVAATLDLTEEAVKQRLSRGRKMLHEHVLSFVEGALQRSNPGKAFTEGVVLALPALTTSSKIAALGAGAAKGSATAKSATAAGIVGALMVPVMIVFGYWTGYRMGLDGSRSEGERRMIRGFYLRLVACLVYFFVAYVFLMTYGRHIAVANPALFTGLAVGLAVTYTMASIGLSVYSYRRRRDWLAKLPPEVQAEKKPAVVMEYRSKRSLLGFPLIHLRLGRERSPRGTLSQERCVKAWIAIGDCPIGLLFAFGGSAVAPIAVGGSATGIIAFGGFAMGIFGLGGFSIAVWALGGLAIGWQAFGGFALAVHTAMGGIAIAHYASLGQIAQGPQANTAMAEAIIGSNWFYAVCQFVLRYMLVLHALWVVPLFLLKRAVQRKKTTA